MRKILLSLTVAVCCISAHAQESFSDNYSGSIKLGAGYVYDFPGMNGYGVHGNYSFPLSEWLQGEAGLKRIEASGFPRTSAIKEFTKASVLDFNLLAVPFHSDNAAFRIGGGYSFSFYHILRSYPSYGTAANGPTAKDPSWQTQESKGRMNGFSLTAEYEYYFQNKVSAGVRVSLCKAYNNVLMAGPFAAINF